MKNYISVIRAAAYPCGHAVALLLLLITLVGGTSVEGQTKPKKEPPRHVATSPPSIKTGQQLSYEIIPAAQNSFGYNILSGTKKLVHQPSVPGLAGNRGFLKKEDAKKCAQLVINKINNNIMPPTVTRQELDSLKIKL
jgi:hypothetical protein